MVDKKSEGCSQAGSFPVFYVRVPAGWKPTTVDEIPPNVERLEFDSPQAAAAFRRLFNERELKGPTGRWAVG